MVAIRRALEPQETAAAKENQRKGGRGKKVGKVSTPLKARDKVAEFTGVSGRTLDKATAVVEAAESDPDTPGHLISSHYGMP